MKAAFRLLFLLFVLGLFFIQCKKEEPEPDPLYEITDIHFLHALIERGVDTNGDGVISYAEAAPVTSLDISSCNISDLSGIALFIHLETLYCYDNQLSQVNLSKNIELEILDCSQNSLTVLDVTHNTALRYLNCWQNNLSTLDVSENP